MTDRIRFIDAHHHLWIPESTDPDLGYRWLRDIGAMKPFGDPTPIQRNYEWSEFAQESQHEMAGSVYLQVDGAIADPVAETAWVQSVFHGTGLSHAIIGLVDLASANAVQILESQCRFTGFRGVRQILSRLENNPALCFAPIHYLRNAVWRDHFKLLDEHGLSFDMQLYPEQMIEAAEFLANFPNVPIIVDHAGSPYDQSPAGLDSLNEGLKVLASLEQVSIKLCGFGMFDVERSAKSVQPVIEQVFEHFGSTRVMFGSNFPVDKLMGTYDEVINLVGQNLVGMDATQRQAFWHDNAARVYRL